MSLQSLLRVYKGQILALEADQSMLLGNVLKDARSELAQRLERNPNSVYDRNFSATLDSILADFEGTSIDYEQVYDIASRQAVGIIEETTSILAQPFLNFGVLLATKSEGTDLIVNVSQDLKEDILKKVRISQATGGNLRDLMDSILGTGIRGTMARDGSFRTARWRSEAIARTTVNDLVNKAALANYQAVQQDTPGLTLMKEWVTTSDNRTSPVCESLRGQRKNLDEPFSSPLGWSGQAPPAHPFCRSRVISIVKK